jgi:hypothetical protein
VKPAVTSAEKTRAEEIGAAAMKEVLSKSIQDIFLNLRPEDILAPDPDAEIIKGNAYQPAAWGHSPAHYEFNAGSDNRLLRCAKLAGIPGNQVQRVHARLIKGTELVAVSPADPNDTTALPVNRYAGNSSAWVNLITLLGPYGLTLDTGYRELYHTAYIPKGSPLWPGIFMDIGKYVKRRKESAGSEGDSEGGEGEGDENAE